jgi:hypothetical protein
MKPAWDKLMKDFEGSATALVGDVDCTADGKPLCDSNGVQGFPTIKWGDPTALEDYQGGREYDDLKKFADENLKPICGPNNIDLCDDDKKAEIEKFQAMGEDDLNSEIAEKEKEIKALEENFESELKNLQETYEKISEEKDDGIKAVKDSGLGIMKAVLAQKKAA